MLITAQIWKELHTFTVIKSWQALFLGSSQAFGLTEKLGMSFGIKLFLTWALLNKQQSGRHCQVSVDDWHCVFYPHVYVWSGFSTYLSICVVKLHSQKVAKGTFPMEKNKSSKLLRVLNIKVHSKVWKFYEDYVACVVSWWVEFWWKKICAKVKWQCCTISSYKAMAPGVHEGGRGVSSQHYSSDLHNLKTGRWKTRLMKLLLLLLRVNLNFYPHCPEAAYQVLMSLTLCHHTQRKEPSRWDTVGKWVSIILMDYFYLCLSETERN